MLSEDWNMGKRVLGWMCVMVLLLMATACTDGHKDRELTGEELYKQRQAQSSQESSNSAIDQTQEPDSQSGLGSGSSSGPTGLSVDPKSWNLILVNKYNRLSDDFEVELGVIPSQYRVNDSANQVDARALESLLSMIEGAAADGIVLRVTSAYRDAARQVMLYENKVQEYLNSGYGQEQAEEEASKYVAIPGTSEHCTGLALDIISADWYTYNNDLYDTFENTEEFAWLDAHAHEYGFILRYMKNKTEITEISYEPWHYRYVGVDAAREIKEGGLCLEEYLGQA